MVRTSSARPPSTVTSRSAVARTIAPIVEPSMNETPASSTLRSTDLLTSSPPNSHCTRRVRSTTRTCHHPGSAGSNARRATTTSNGLKRSHQRIGPQPARPPEAADLALRRTAYLTGLGSGRLRLELGQLLVDQAQVDDVIAELTVQQLELLAGHQDGRGAAARAGHHGRLLPQRTPVDRSRPRIAAPAPARAAEGRTARFPRPLGPRPRRTPARRRRSDRAQLDHLRRHRDGWPGRPE